MTAAPTADTLTLGLLAGGRASRLGGRDKAWLARDGVAQVLRLQQAFAPRVTRVLVSANTALERYAAHGLDTVQDRVTDAGPLSGLDALVAATTTPWLLTLPVDLVHADTRLLPMLALLAGETGAYAIDDDGVQPLVALWSTTRTGPVIAAAFERGDYAVRGLQQALGMQGVRLDGVRFGNLNTPDDLIDAGIADP
ncbi:molybdenum cofactor guanylyltransferase [Luteimonas sp. WGS1318]|uniref:molybdenum cofactor guanylyltransferase n=1 Tax=Luteimonas sp. WGS1318 TaxID=3366815 RepID=UPI00372D62D6